MSGDLRRKKKRSRWGADLEGDAKAIEPDAGVAGETSNAQQSPAEGQQIGLHSTSKDWSPAEPEVVLDSEVCTRSVEIFPERCNKAFGASAKVISIQIQAENEIERTLSGVKRCCYDICRTMQSKRPQGR